ncbi:hypothetical protein DX927_17930 [Bacillus swezeyi]|uniref:Uncharacterized protein n=1 Tax=Bacillus swezeyi TaxID=1925020 RepID=A0A5M8RIQ6_9BACI|nr:hypothetical protein DX927_17930 [Bacillus swezeyi]
MPPRPIILLSLALNEQNWGYLMQAEKIKEHPSCIETFYADLSSRKNHEVELESKMDDRYGGKYRKIA